MPRSSSRQCRVYTYTPQNRAFFSPGGSYHHFGRLALRKYWALAGNLAQNRCRRKIATRGPGEGSAHRWPRLVTIWHGNPSLNGSPSLGWGKSKCSERKTVPPPALSPLPREAGPLASVCSLQNKQNTHYCLLQAIRRGIVWVVGRGFWISSLFRGDQHAFGNSAGSERYNRRSASRAPLQLPISSLQQNSLHFGIKTQECAKVSRRIATARHFEIAL